MFLLLLNRMKSMVWTCELKHDVEDRISWIHDNGGEFSVKKLSHWLVMV